MKIEKLPSGSYRIRKTYRNKTYSIVVPYKPSQKQALKLMSDKLEDLYECAPITFSDACIQYISQRESISSPTTIRAYKCYLNALSPRFKNTMLENITQFEIQKEINEQAKKHSPKTVRNYHGLISAVLGVFKPDLRINTSLPQKLKNEPYIPSKEDIYALIESLSGTEYEIPVKLACYGLRKSEICGLDISDLDHDNVITINKALVEGEKNQLILKTTKTTSSTRKIKIDETLAEQIRSKGYIYRKNPDTISEVMKRKCKELGIQEFTLHKLRHFFCSYLHEQGYSDQTIMDLGGWETDHVMKAVYRHSMNTAKKDEASSIISRDIFKLS